jgi:ABC-type Zn uptake system ZnuABC Zn-binding protein ZnuA
MEPGTNTQLADQISSQTGKKVNRDLYTHSITHKDGNAPTYIDMILWNTDQIIKSLGKP